MESSPTISPDASPVRRPRVKHFVIVKEYIQQSKSVHPQYLEKTILKEQIITKKNERDSGFDAKLINYVTNSSPDISHNASPQNSPHTSPQNSPHTSPQKQKIPEVIVRSMSRAISSENDIVNTNNTVSANAISVENTMNSGSANVNVKPHWWSVGLKRNGLALVGGLLLAGSVGMLFATNNKTSTS